MSKPEHSSGTGVVVGDFSKKKKPKNIKKILIIFGVIIAVVAVVGAVAWYVVQSNKSPIAADGRDTRLETVNEATKLADQGKTKEAKNKIEQVFKKVKTDEDKTRYLGYKISLCLKIKDYECALEANAERSKIAGNELTGLMTEATIYLAKNDKAQAKQVYQDALEQANQLQSEDKRAYIEEIQSRLERLQ